MFRFLVELLERPLKIGAILQNKYKITSLVGRGSYGIVYLAIDLDTSRVVIVKQHRERKGKDCKGMLKNEAKTLQLLNHPSIPKCLNFFQEEQKYFLVMEYVEGKNFEDIVLNEGQVYDEKESLQILLKVLNVVKYLHDNMLIHRDLRLPNIINKGNQVYIIDFGLAVLINKNQDSISSSNDFELIRDISYKDDFCSLGHFVLFLLYSNFDITSKKEKSWEEELIVSNETKGIIKRLLRQENSYDHINEIIRDLKLVIQML